VAYPQVRPDIYQLLPLSLYCADRIVIFYQIVFGVNI